MELSVVIPCLNEEDTLAECIRKAQQALLEGSVVGEVIVADNGSTDRSTAIARELNAVLVTVEARGYGSALMAGIAAARGRYVVMGDGDDSYDFREIPRFLQKLRAGAELVQGCRLPSGGGRIENGAMPLLHRWVGNPVLSRLARAWFGSPVHDVYCGMRGFSRDLYLRLDLRCTGMEFATEMIIKASLRGSAIAEVPITLHLDGRRSHAPHLRTFRDGWRTLRLFLLYSPRWLFVLPGAALVLIGLIGYALAMPGTLLLGVVLDAHTLLVSSLAILCGYQAILFALFTKTFAIGEGLLPMDSAMKRFFALFDLEKALLAGVGTLLLGLLLILQAFNEWRLMHFGPLDYARTMRWVIPGVLLAALAFQTILSSFFVSLLGMRRK